jgi:hypothetical protein
MTEIKLSLRNTFSENLIVNLTTRFHILYEKVVVCFVCASVVSPINSNRRQYPSSRAQLVKKFPAFCWARRFVAVFTKSAIVPIPCQMNPIHTLTSHLLRFTLILSSHLRLGLSSGLFHPDFLTVGYRPNTVDSTSFARTGSGTWRWGSNWSRRGLIFFVSIRVTE